MSSTLSICHVVKLSAVAVSNRHSTEHQDNNSEKQMHHNKTMQSLVLCNLLMDCWTLTGGSQSTRLIVDVANVSIRRKISRIKQRRLMKNGLFSDVHVGV